MANSKPVAVGIDGSKSSLYALEWAADEAVRRNTSLQVIHVTYEPWAYLAMSRETAATVSRTFHEQGRALVDDAIAHARSRLGGAHPGSGLEISGHVHDGDVAPALLAATDDVELLVLGSRGLGGLGSMLLGSVGLQVAAHAPCPVVVVRGNGHPDAEVVVGVDNSELSVPAIEFAFREASAREVPLQALHCWLYPVDRLPGPFQPLADELAEIEAGERHRLSELTAPIRQRFPDVPSRERLVQDNPVHALVTASAQASLLVVGTRGRGGFAGLVLGSVSHGALHHANCPVAVVGPGRQQ